MGTFHLTRHIPAQKATSFVLKKGFHLKVVTPHAEQISDLFCFNANDYRESLSAGRSIDFNNSILLTTGHTLYSNRSEAMLKICEDTCGRHDFLVAPCNLSLFQRLAKNDEYHPSCEENLLREFINYGIEDNEITTTFNIFMNLGLSESGATRNDKSRAKAGDYIVFEACMDLLVGLTACAHEARNGYRCKPIHYQTYIPT